MSLAGGGLSGWKRNKPMEPASKSNNYHYNKKLQPFANKLRKEMTKAEVCLWKYVLKAKKLKGYQFRRQRPVLNYIADFMCMDLMLVIEVDGITHWDEEVVKKDEIRQKKLEEVGFPVIRFDDNDVLHDIENVERELLGFVEDFEEIHTVRPRTRQRSARRQGKNHPLATHKPTHSPASGGNGEENLTQETK